jgi:hypothetical protein
MQVPIGNRYLPPTRGLWAIGSARRTQRRILAIRLAVQRVHEREPSRRSRRPLVRDGARSVTPVSDPLLLRSRASC